MISGDACLDTVWIRRYHPAVPGAVRLVCLPHAGGAASFYRPLATALSRSAAVLAVQYPGRQDRRHEALADTIEHLADQVAVALRPIAGKPLALFGHSMGAIVAFEVARRMRSAGYPAPIRLFASGRRAPSRHRDERVHSLPDEELIAELTSLGGPNVDLLTAPEIIEMVLPAVRGDYRAIESYRYRTGVPLDCPVTVLTGDNDPLVTVDEARSWGEHTTGATDLHVFPGGHFFVTEQLTAVIDVVAAALHGSAALPGSARLRLTDKTIPYQFWRDNGGRLGESSRRHPGRWRYGHRHCNASSGPRSSSCPGRY
jgi:surfactin synthase thioesterase subunit